MRTFVGFCAGCNTLVARERAHRQDIGGSAMIFCAPDCIVRYDATADRSGPHMPTW